MGVAGMIVLLIMIAVWRKMENKSPVKPSGKTIGAVLISIIGSLLARSWNVSHNGMESYGNWYYNRNCGNRYTSLSDSIY